MTDPTDAGIEALLDTLRAVQPAHQLDLADSHVRATTRITRMHDRTTRPARSMAIGGGIAEGGVG